MIYTLKPSGVMKAIIFCIHSLGWHQEEQSNVVCEEPIMIHCQWQEGEYSISIADFDRWKEYNCHKQYQ